MDKEKRLKYIRELKKLSDEDFDLIQNNNKNIKDIVFMIVFIFAVFQLGTMVAINVINNGITIFNLSVSWSAFLLFSYLTILTEVKILLLVIGSLSFYILLNKNYPKIKEIKNKLKEKVEGNK